MTEFYESIAKAYVSVDCIIFGFDEGKLKLLLGKRKMEPGRGEWSLYGGFVGPSEGLDEASQRTLFELTGMQGVYMRQIGAYGAVNRDPGSRVVSVAYCALINVRDYDDELCEKFNLQWVAVDELPQLYSDHNQMVEDALRELRRRLNYEPLSFSLLPELFTLTQLQNVFEAILNKELDKRNFRKRVKMIDTIVVTDKIDKKTSKRGAALYKYTGGADDFHF